MVALNGSRIRLFSLLLFFIGIMACKTDDNLVPDTPGAENSGNSGSNNRNITTNKMNVRIGSSTFTATLLNSETATAFKARLPITLSMNELNGNEKFADLPNRLPTNSSNPGTIQTGDLMLYGSNTLVLFYETFRTSYTYTKLGRIDNPAGLAAALGSKNVTVSFELQ